MGSKSLTDMLPPCGPVACGIPPGLSGSLINLARHISESGDVNWDGFTTNQLPIQVNHSHRRFHPIS